MLTPKHFMYAIYALSGLTLVSVGANAYQTYRINTLSDTIQKQLRGELSEAAMGISQTRQDIKTLESQMVTGRELSSRIENILEGLDKSTRDSIERFQAETGAKIDSISVRMTSIEAKLKGKAKVGTEPTTPIQPPPASWQGITNEDAARCVSFPSFCDPLEFTWSTPYGKPLASFFTDNFWGGDYTLELKLEFKAIVIEYAEDQSSIGSGAVRNQGLHILAGYTNEKGDFIPIAEDKLMQGNPNLDSRFFYTPKVDPQNIKLKKLRLFEPSLLVGISYLDKLSAFSAGASLLNLQGGDYRLGVQMALTNKQPYLAGVVSYHPYVLGKHLNISPAVGWAVGMDGSNTWVAGLYFQVW